MPSRGLDLRPEVVDEAADHLVGEPLKLRVDGGVVLRGEGIAARHEVDVDHQSPVGREVSELQVGRAVQIVGRGNRAVTGLGEGDRELVKVDKAEPELPAQ